MQKTETGAAAGARRSEPFALVKVGNRSQFCNNVAFLILLLFLAIAYPSPRVLGQQDFSWFGNQIIENSTQTIPAGDAYVFYFQVMKPSTQRIDVSSGHGQSLSVFLMTDQAHTASERAGTLSNWIHRRKGNSISFESPVLAPGRYVLRVENYLNSPQRANVRVWSRLATDD